MATLLAKRAPRLLPRFAVTKFATACKSMARSIRRHFARFTYVRIQPHHLESRLPPRSLRQRLLALITTRGLRWIRRPVHIASRDDGARTKFYLRRLLGWRRPRCTCAWSQRFSVNSRVADIIEAGLTADTGVALHSQYARSN